FSVRSPVSVNNSPFEASQALCEPVERLVPADLASEVPGGGALVDDEELRAGDLREVCEDLDVERRAHHRVVRSTRGEPCLRRRGEVGTWPPYRPRDRQLRERLGRGDDVDRVDGEAEPVAH